MSDERQTSTETTVVDGGRPEAHDAGAHDPEALIVTCVVPGQARDELPAGATGDAAPLERYHDEGELAGGGMGTVRRMLDRHIMRPVAMKRVEQMSRQQALRFLEEAQITGQLDHPNIVPLYDLSVDDQGMPRSFTMKLIEGVTLGELVDQSHLAGGGEARPPSSAQEARRLERLLRVVVKVCDAVAYAHSRGVVHRDLKPANIMVGQHGQVYVMDWGVARLRGHARPSERDALRLDPERRSHEEPGMVIGTVSYMAPEQAAGDVEQIDERTDVFGIGGILYEILTGRPPHPGATSWDEVHRQALRCEVPAPEPADPDRPLPPRLCEITMKALAADPARRFQTVVELQRALRRFLRGGGWFATVQFEPGTVIVAQGERGDCAYIISEGTCEVYKDQGQGPTSVGTLGPGEVFGEMAILTDHPRNASVRALTEVEAAVVTRESLDRELASNDWLSIIMRAFAQRYRGVQPREEE